MEKYWNEKGKKITKFEEYVNRRIISNKLEKKERKKERKEKKKGELIS